MENQIAAAGAAPFQQFRTGQTKSRAPEKQNPAEDQVSESEPFADALAVAVMEESVAAPQLLALPTAAPRATAPKTLDKLSQHVTESSQPMLAATAISVRKSSTGSSPAQGMRIAQKPTTPLAKPSEPVDAGKLPTQLVNKQLPNRGLQIESVRYQPSPGETEEVSNAQAHELLNRSLSDRPLLEERLRQSQRFSGIVDRLRAPNQGKPTHDPSSRQSEQGLGSGIDFHRTRGLSTKQTFRPDPSPRGAANELLTHVQTLLKANGGERSQLTLDVSSELWGRLQLRFEDSQRHLLIRFDSADPALKQRVDALRDELAAQIRDLGYDDVDIEFENRTGQHHHNETSQGNASSENVRLASDQMLDSQPAPRDRD